MRGMIEKTVQSWASAAPAAAGINVNHPLREIATMLGGREAVLVGLKLVLRASLTHADLAQQLVAAREYLRQLHGRISLIGPLGTGLVPQALWGDEVAAVNAELACGASANAGGFGGTSNGATIPAATTVATESTIPLMYAPAAFVNGPIGRAGIYDGAIDAALFGSSTILNIDNLFAAPTSAGAIAQVVTLARLDLVAVYATCEPGEHLAPTRPQYRRLGNIDQDPRIFGLGQRSDLRALICSCTPAQTLAWMAARDLQAQVLGDGSPIASENLSMIVRAGLDRCSLGGVLRLGQPANGWQSVHSSISVPQASQRHVAATLELQGFLNGAGEDQAVLLAWINQAPDSQDLDEWSRKRGVNLSAGGRLSGGATALDLSADQSVGVAPEFGR